MLIYVGKSSNAILKRKGINTIGDLANYDKNKLIKLLGKSGETIYNFANGIDSDKVSNCNKKYTPKSISKGFTFKEDLTEFEDQEKQVKIMCDFVSLKLREKNLKCTVVGLSIKDSNFITLNRQRKIYKTNLFQEISKIAVQLLRENYVLNKPIRAITVNVGNLINPNDEIQMNIFSIEKFKKDNNKIENVTKVLDSIRSKYGAKKINFGSMTNL